MPPPVAGSPPVPNPSAQVTNPAPGATASLLPPAVGTSDPAGVFSDPTSSDADRLAAASTLLESAREPQIALVNRGLGADDPPGARRAALGALLLLAQPPTACVPALAEALVGCEGEIRAQTVSALARFRTREAIRPLIQALTATPTPPDADRLGDALGRQSGMLELGSDPERWSAWWREVEYLPEAEWRARLADAHAKRADALEARQRQLNARLDESVRKAYSLLPSDERLAYLETMLGDPAPEMRALGLDLAERRLLNNRPLSGAVIAAALLELANPSGEVRVRAARIVSKLAMPEHASAVASALRAERDPMVAAALQQYLVARPDASVVPELLRWAEAPGMASASAIDALAAFVRTAPEIDSATVARIGAVVQRSNPAELNSSGLELLILSDGVGSVTSLLSHPDEAVVFNAADALARSGRGLGELIESARTRPALFSPTERAIRAQMATADGYRCLGLLAEPASAPGAISEAKASLGPLLSAPDLLAVAQEESDPVMRERVLEHLESPEFAAQLANDPRWWACVEALALTRLELRDPAGALDVIEALPEGGESSLASGYRVTALVMLGRLDEAERESEQAGLDPEPWLEGLERATDLVRAEEVRVAIERMFSDSMNAAQSTRFKNRVAVLDALALRGTFDPAGLLPWARVPSRWLRQSSRKPDEIPEIGPPAPEATDTSSDPAPREEAD